ncbi:IS3 family transposase [Desulfuromonas acetoxidans]|uniref:IS3 family transposase n=1 Tax=Desulfuromonas acetoxidans TaxID=891 RepID=UPI00292EF1E7|nr:IS3 family transposase [Desulfuromonas acetoxidans]
MDRVESKRSRRTQRDYTMGFKLQVVDAVEKGDMTYKQAQKIYGIQGRSTVLTWLRKHGKLDWTQPVRLAMPKTPKAKETPAQKIKRLERELEDERLRNLLLNEVVDILDSEHGMSLRKKYIAKARRIQKHKGLSLSRACKLLGISRQAVYQRERRTQQRNIELAPVKGMVMELRRFMPRLGGRKLYSLLKPKFDAQGIKLGRDGFFDYLREHRLLVPPVKRFIKTTQSRHWMKKYPNLIASQDINRAEQVFVSDITYVETDEGIHYLSLVTDAYSRKIMGYEVSDNLRAESVVKALRQAARQRQTGKPLLHHSDRGLQYCSSIYQEELKRHDITPSMTDGYDCYQNALAERVNGILKQEFLLFKCRDLQELKDLVRESVAIYNRLRPHLSLNMKTPEEVHKKATSMGEVA